MLESAKFNFFGLPVVVDGFVPHLRQPNPASDEFKIFADLYPAKIPPDELARLYMLTPDLMAVYQILFVYDRTTPVVNIVNGKRPTGKSGQESFMFVRQFGPKTQLEVARYTNRHRFVQGSQDHPYGFDVEDLRRSPKSFGCLKIIKENHGYLITRDKSY